jgi:predicted DNA-binding transcriptional regulator AlpA
MLDHKALETGVYSFRDLQALGFVRDRQDLSRKQKHYGFPKPFRLSKQESLFLRQEVHAWLRQRAASRQTEQAEHAAE